VVDGPMTGAPGACAGVARTPCGEKAASYNVARRVVHQPRLCNECGGAVRAEPVGRTALFGCVRVAPFAPAEEARA
jgi:hypothetical protein